MSIISEINRIKTNIANAYNEAEEKGAEMPQIKNSNNLANAIKTIRSGTDTSDATALQNEILEGKTAYIAEGKVEGTMKPSPITQEDYDTAINISKDILGFEPSSGVKYGPYNEKITSTTTVKIGSYIKEIPLIDTSNIVNMESMFSGCSSLEKIPLIDTGKVTSMYNMFYNCKNLKTIPLLNTGKVTNMNSMFLLSGITEIPALNTENVTSMYGTFQTCLSLTKIPLIDTGKVTSISNAFTSDTKIVELGGFKDLGKAYTQTTTNYSYYTLSLSNCSQLTHDSLMNIINNLYDLNLSYDVANGGTLYRQQVQLHRTAKALLSAEEIAIATAKGWDIV